MLSKISTLLFGAILFCSVSYATDLETCRSQLGKYASQDPNVYRMFDETAAGWVDYERASCGDFDLAKLLDAVSFAAQKHQGQTRKNSEKTPYIIHPIGVSRILFDEGEIRSPNILIAALLHDTLEDTDTSFEEIADRFGPRVAESVRELTNDPCLSSQENKQRQIEHAPFMSHDAALVKLADRIYNIRDLNTGAFSEDAKRIYVSWGEKLGKALAGTHPSLEKKLEELVTAKKIELAKIVREDMDISVLRIQEVSYDEKSGWNTLRLEDESVWHFHGHSELALKRGETVGVGTLHTTAPEYSRNIFWCLIFWDDQLNELHRAYLGAL